jgi:hypothetical protein
MIRSECVKKRDSVPVMQVFDDWIEERMDESLHVVHERDVMLASVVYSVKVPMTDDHFDFYLQALAHFPDARDLHNLLVKGKDELDNVTRVHQDSAGRPTWALLTQPNMTLEQMMMGMVKGDRLSIPWDRRRPTERLELLPTELGGTLRDYPEPS